MVISDYNKGYISEEDIKFISQQHENTFLETKKILGDWCADIKYIKINEFEYNRTKHMLNKEMESKIWSSEHTRRLNPDWRSYASKPIFSGGSNGIPNRVDRTIALGNSVVPQVAAIPLQRVLDIDRGV